MTAICVWLNKCDKIGEKAGDWIEKIYQRVFQTQTVYKLSQYSLDTVEVQALELKVY